VPQYLILHSHTPEDCGVAFAAWKGVDSPLRGHATRCSCWAGDHRMWWSVTAADVAAAEALLPRWVRARSEVIEVRDVLVP
jgi:hypothetical protein